MDTIISFFSHTPTYVYLILAYLLVLGFKASCDRVVPLSKNVLMVVAFSYLSFNSLAKLELSIFYYILFGVTFLISGYFLGWRQVSRKKILVDKEKWLLQLPGSWLTLFLVLLIFSSKYFLGFKSGVDPSFLQTAIAKTIAIFTSGFSLGSLFGRLLNYLYRFKVENHTELFEKKEATKS
jgi:hypothetical protein